MRHGLKWFIHLRAQRPRVGDEHPAYAPAGAWLLLPFLHHSMKNWKLVHPADISLPQPAKLGFHPIAPKLIPLPLFFPPSEGRRLGLLKMTYYVLSGMLDHLLLSHLFTNCECITYFLSRYFKSSQYTT